MESYKKRMIEEYQQTKERYDRLHKLIVKHDAGTLGFKLNCPIDLLKEQETHMRRYLFSLEKRAEIEGVSLDWNPHADRVP